MHDIVDATATGRPNEYCFILSNSEVCFRTIKLAVEEIYDMGVNRDQTLVGSKSMMIEKRPILEDEDAGQAQLRKATMIS